MAMSILGFVFLVVGAPFIWLARRAFARDRAMAQWPRTSGVVTSARLESSTHRSTDKNTGLHSYGTLYTPSVRYTYSVGDQTFEGTSIARSLDGCAMPKDEANRIMEKYPPQAQVTVLYDAAAPKTAYLEIRRSIGAIILFAFGLMWIAVGTLLVTLSLV
jgi:hypothetical protein